MQRVQYQRHTASAKVYRPFVLSPITATDVSTCTPVHVRSVLIYKHAVGYVGAYPSALPLGQYLLWVLPDRSPTHQHIPCKRTHEWR